jgi:hypothetical protein
MSAATPLDYAGRCERYARQRGWAYDEHRMSIGHLTPRQRKRALKKERHANPVHPAETGPYNDGHDGAFYDDDDSPADEYLTWPRDDSPSYRDTFAY